MGVGTYNRNKEREKEREKRDTKKKMSDGVLLGQLVVIWWKRWWRRWRYSAAVARHYGNLISIHRDSFRFLLWFFFFFLSFFCFVLFYFYSFFSPLFLLYTDRECYSTKSAVVHSPSCFGLTIAPEVGRSRWCCVTVSSCRWLHWITLNNEKKRTFPV